MSQPQPRHGARRAFGIINANSTPRKAPKGGASSIADEVHSAKKDKQSNLFSSMATRSSKKRAASLKEADEKEKKFKRHCGSSRLQWDTVSNRRWPVDEELFVRNCCHVEIFIAADPGSGVWDL